MMRESQLRTFEGAVAIITGGASGIGRALGEVLARRGAQLVLADLQSDLVRQTAASIEQSGGKATGVELDVTDSRAVKRVVDETHSRWGRLDYIFNNAGIAIGGPVRLYEAQDWDRVLDVNLRGVAYGIQAAYPVMIDQGFGHIVNTASMAAFMPSPGASSYGASKHAVVGLSSSLRVEAEDHGVRVSVLCPGVVRTPILQDGGRYGKMLQPLPPADQLSIWEPLRPMDPLKFGSRVLTLVARNRAIIIVPAWWKVFWWMNRLSPSLGRALARRSYVALNRKYFKQP